MLYSANGCIGLAAAVAPTRAMQAARRRSRVCATVVETEEPHAGAPIPRSARPRGAVVDLGRDHDAGLGARSPVSCCCSARARLRRARGPRASSAKKLQTRRAESSYLTLRRFW